jgi:hypothetical protein
MYLDSIEIRGKISINIIIIIIIIIIKSSFSRDNNYSHYVIQRIAGFMHPAGLDVIMVVYHLLYDLLLFFFLVWVGGLGWLSINNISWNLYSKIVLVSSLQLARVVAWLPKLQHPNEDLNKNRLPVTIMADDDL